MQSREVVVELTSPLSGGVQVLGRTLSPNVPSRGAADARWPPIPYSLL
jgi:hypothetical protein